MSEDPRFESETGYVAVPDDKAPRKRSKLGGCLRWGLAIVVGGPIFFVAALMFSMRPYHQPSFFVNVTVDMVANGEAVQIKKTVECKTFEVPPGELFQRLWKRAPTRYAATVGAFGQKLSDGSAVMMWNPYHCARQFPEDDRKRRDWDVYPVPEGALPYMAWTPNADDPATIEFYTHSSYFARPEARIRDVRMSFERAPRRAKPSPPDVFDGFTGQKLRLGERKSGLGSQGYGSFVAVVIDRKDWQGINPEFDAALAAYTEPVMLPKTRLSEEGQSITGVAIQAFRKRYGDSRSRLPAQSRYEPFTNYGSDKYSSAGYQIMAVYDKDPLIAGMFQLRLGEDALNVERTDVAGVVTLIRLGSETFWPTGIPMSSVPYQRGQYRINPGRAVEIDGRPTRYHHFSQYLYDPATGELFWIAFTGATLFSLDQLHPWASDWARQVYDRRKTR